MFVSEGFIKAVKKSPGRGRVLDYSGSGYLIVPGFIDLHVHLRGFELSYREDELSGGLAAIASGITLVIDMPNTRPRVADRDLVRLKLDRLSRIPVDHSIFSGIPEDLGEIALIDSEPVAGYKVYPMDILYRWDSIVEVLKSTRKLIVLHPELPEAEKPVIEGVRARGVHRNCGLEASAVSLLSSIRGQGIHVTHASCRSTVSIAKSHGYTVDVTPHHIFYSMEVYEGCMYKVNPPLRPEYERASILGLLLEGVIDAVASDHAPHALWEKFDPLSCNPGIPWLEAWPWILYRLVHAGALTLSQYLYLVSRGPSKVLGLDGLYGFIGEGARADLLVFDPSYRGRFTGALYSRARHYTVFMEELYGRPIEVFLGGEVVYSGGEVLEGIRGINPFTLQTL